MIDLLKNEKEFTVLFFGMLTIDILVKLYCPAYPYRYLTKPPIVLMLFFYYHFNNKEKNKKKHLWINLALLMFFIGDILIINHTNVVLLGASLLFFALGKLFLSFRFSHKFDFNISRLIPFSIIMFVYTVFIVSYLFNSLKNFFVPALISFFISLLLFQFAFLRKDAVNKISYMYVFFGVILYIICESMMAIKTFKTDLPLQDLLIMLLYGVSLYFITMGIVKERRRKIVLNPF
ncbi:lysoplasmalogenase family protein [Mariniflexile sp.]|uniref:lysoplasmalogenase family protein n=1 Tax=Mariniflexile sp. TaxID=1979402 RepID=UPI0040481985